MGKIEEEEEDSNFNGGLGGNGQDFSGSTPTIFPELKYYCLQLLELLHNPHKQRKNNSSSSSPPCQLLQLLRCSPASSLQPFFDYILFPLLLLLDAAVGCRALPKGDDPDGSSFMSGAPKAPPQVSDHVAEAVLDCLEELLTKCALGSVDQMVVLLKKLTNGALLSPSEAPEEFRVGIIKCFRALLLCLDPCIDELCQCKQVVGLPVQLVRKDSVSKPASEAEQCLLAFLQSESASAAVGHWLSLLLKAADVEAARGHRGSATLRVEAFKTLRVLIAKVGNADALAFFLPGVISQIGKVLHMSKTMVSGAAGNTEALDQAIRSLAEFLSIVLKDDQNLPSLSQFPDDSIVHHICKEKPLVSFLDELRHLASKTQDQGEVVVHNVSEAVQKSTSMPDIRKSVSVNPEGTRGAFRVERSKDWIINASAHINKILSKTFPHLSCHPSKKVRLGILAAMQTLLLSCSYTLRGSRLLLLECICVLVCDDSEEVSSAAQVFFGYLFSSNREHLEHDFDAIFSRLIDKIPHAVLGNNESMALSHARKLLVVIYFSGPRFVAIHLLQSSVTAARFLDIFALCLSPNTTFSGSLDKLVAAKPPSAGYMHSIAEMKSMRNAGSEGFESPETTKVPYPPKNVSNAYVLPGLPPWFAYISGQKLYKVLAAVLRLVGLSLFTDSQNEGSLSVTIDIPLGYLRKLISEIRTRECSMESWESWYNRTGSGQLVRQASTAVCILNEMIYGLSDQAISSFGRMFQHSNLKWQEIEECDANGYAQPCKCDQPVPDNNLWHVCNHSRARNNLIHSIGSVLHEYLSPEVWTLPLDHTDSSIQSYSGGRALALHFFNDNAVLHQVIIEGIGVLTMCLGKEFSSSGFLHSSLFMLLENLICSNFEVKSASDAVLHIMAATLDYPTVGHLVLANSDYVIDSICRQLRHLDLNPHMPNVLAAILSYIGVAHKILPLLEEPMRAVSLELEILGRHQHPDLTVPFLKAVAEIGKASKQEACTLPNQAEALYKDIKSNILDLEKRKGNEFCSSRSSIEVDATVEFPESEVGICYNHDSRQIQHWESVLFKLNDSRRCRSIVGSIAGSCLIAAAPLLASSMLAACLIALDVIEDAIETLAKVEDAYKLEKKAKAALHQIFDLYSLHNLRDALDAAEDEAGENRLLPAMNKIWPFLIACVRNKNPVAVQRCSCTISNMVQICGGDFFSRRFHTNGIHLWKLLGSSPFEKKPISREDRTPLQLPYGSVSFSSEGSVAELSDLKVQAAVLNMIADIAKNKRSASALEAVLKKVSGLVVGIACSGVMGLRDAAINALVGLASIDPDLVWLLVADIYLSLKKKDVLSPPGNEFPEVSQILPSPSSSKGYLYFEYGGQSYGFDIDFSAVEHVFKLLDGQYCT
ncbi:uncharacterized protein [Coffea arabica]|uniref:Uncharacterized protein isoform X1 n=1 Tax=Coffea arabica TaxID=13443 RepID=A0ABM4VA33_COFAR